MNHSQPQRSPQSSEPINLRSAVITIVAGTLGAIAGALAGSRIPSDKFAWTGFALAPLFVLLELMLKHLATAFGGDRNATRFTLAGAIVVGFYGAWFGMRLL